MQVKVGSHWRLLQLVPFEAQKNIFYIQKGPILERFTPECKRHLRKAISRQDIVDIFAYKLRQCTLVNACLDGISISLI
jgi:hypothetical protein